jgi:hypothetical protein
MSEEENPLRLKPPLTPRWAASTSLARQATDAHIGSRNPSSSHGHAAPPCVSRPAGNEIAVRLGERLGCPCK